MSRIAKQKIDYILNNKIEVLQNIAKELNSVIVLKGAHSLIGYPNGNVFINLSGNPGMATAGSGDVLTGTIAAMLGLGFPINDAVRKSCTYSCVYCQLGRTKKINAKFSRFYDPGDISKSVKGKIESAPGSSLFPKIIKYLYYESSIT